MLPRLARAAGAPAAWFIVAITLVGCASQPASPTTTQGGSAASSAPATPKRVVAAVMSDPYTLSQKLNIAGLTAGIDSLEEVVSAGLTATDNTGRRFAQLAEASPTLENGLWKVLPDGQMETTWKIRSNAKWHDGQPVTSDDLVFTLTVGLDRELAAFRDPTLDLVTGIEAIDAQTATVRWTKPYIYADSLFTRQIALPIPKHLLAKTYAEEKTTLTELPFWTSEFIGNGPFKLHEWQRGSYAIFRAFDDYVLGRPKIDEMEVRFIPEHNTLMSNLLAGAVQLTIGRNLSLDQAMQVRDQWRDGKPEIGLGNWIVIYPQHLNPNPAVVGNVEFRRALVHAIDRGQLADTLMGGQTSVGHSFVSPDEPEYKDVQKDVVRYEYDPRRTVQIIDSLGYAKGADGTYRDATSRPLTLEFRTVDNNQIHMPSVLAVSDYWRSIGIEIENVAIPQQRANEREYRTTFPAVELLQNPNDLMGVSRWHSTRTALPENNYQVFGNNARYMNAELDVLLDRYYATIPRPERTQVVGQMVHHITDQVAHMGLFYVAIPTMVNHRVKNVTARSNGSPGSWNAEAWDLIQ